MCILKNCKGIESLEQNQTQIIWSNRIHRLKYLRSTTFGFNDIVNRKSEFVTKTQFHYVNSNWAKIMIKMYR